MNTLADAAVAAIIYISTAPADDDRADDDVRALESLTWTLRQCSATERDALRAAVERARSAPNPHPDLHQTLQAIENDILGFDPA